MNKVKEITPASGIEEIKEVELKPKRGLLGLLNLFKDFINDGLSLVGLDIGSSSIKLVQIRRKGENVILCNFGYKELPPDFDTKGAKGSALIKRIREDIQSKAHKVSYALYGPSLFITSFNLPPLEKGELNDAIKLELRKVLPFELEETLFDFQVSNLRWIAKDRINVLVCASQEQLVNESVNLLHQAGFNISTLTVTSSILGELIRKGARIEENELVGLIDIGASLTSIGLYQGETLLAAREIVLGGNQLTEALAKSITTDKGQVILNWEQAEELKRTCGIPLKEGEIEFLEMKIKAAQLLDLMNPALERLASEIRRSLDYYTHSLNLSEVKKLFLTGGGSKLKNLNLYLTNSLKINVERLDPLNNINWIDPRIGNRQLLEDLAPHLAVALGLAISKRPKINLLPPKVKLFQGIKIVNGLFKFITPAIVLLFLLLYGATSLMLMRHKHLLEKSKSALIILQPTIEKINVYTEEKKELARQEDLLNQAVGKQPHWGGILREISNLVPEGLSLTKLKLLPEIQPKRLYFEGQIIETYMTVDLILSQFLIALDNSPFFSKVELISTTKVSGTPPMAKFEIESQLVY